MASLANILLVTPMTPSPAGDALWRNADLERLSFVGVIPSDVLLTELLAFKSAGDAGTVLGRLTPGDAHVTTMCSYHAASVRLGVVKNPQVTAAQLTVLTGDSDDAVAQAAQSELARRSTLLQRATTGDIPAAIEILDGMLVEPISMVLALNPATLTRALLGVDAAVLLQRLSVLDPALREALCLAVMTDTDCSIPTAVAQWACSGTLSADAALVAVLGAKTTLRRRLTPNALRVMVQAGHLSATNAVAAPKSYASLDDMAMILDSSEIAAMYFSSHGPASVDLVERVLREAPAGLVVNHLLGQTLRRPLPGQVKALLASATLERRLELADAMQALTEKFLASTETSPITALPWAGELLLGFRRARVGALSVDSAAELFTSINDILTGDANAWEYLLALSDEWEETNFDLIRSAAHMEGIAVEVPAGR
jgi:hypothetical protein